MKKFHCFLLALLLLFSLAPQTLLPVRAESFNGSAGNGVTWSFDTATGVLTIGGSGAMANYDPGKSPWDSHHTQIQSIEIGEGVQSIGAYAFGRVATAASTTDSTATDADPTTEGATGGNPPQSNYPLLTTVSLPSTVVSVGDGAFLGCSSLSTLVVYGNDCILNGTVGSKTLLTIYGHAESAAKAYADTNGYRFESLDGEHTVHNWKRHSYTAATCEEGGIEIAYCAICNAKQTTEYPALGHNPTPIAAVAPTCTKTGKTEGERCLRCAKILKEQETVPALGHDSVPIPAIAPTCTLAGKTEGATCGRCGELLRQQENVYPLGHAFVADVDETGAPIQRCSHCGQVHVDSSFTDTSDTEFYADAVDWAVNNGITSGTSETTFAPDKICTRAQVVTFLWRSAGTPEPETESCPFTDVKPTDYFCKAVLWAVENGITMGTSTTKFSPEDKCTRAQVVTFLWRSAGSTEPTQTHNPFTDVKATAYYYKAVLWAVENSITSGVSKTSFRPDAKCTRAQTVTFLYRARDLLRN